jgi:uncharacterized protein
METLVDNDALSRFEMRFADGLAYADYAKEPGVLRILYVFAEDSLRGTGAAGRLMEAVMAYAREHDLKVVPVCGYAAAWISRHTQWHDLLA